METQRCLYETLGVETTASNEEIRSAYRKLALKWHPDKIQQSGASTEECQEATVQFQEIGRAYEVLADPSERSWYDSHRSQILSSSSSSPSDFDFNPWPFFSPSVYTGYGDTGKGFFAVYGELFTKLHQQEVNFANVCDLRTPLYPPDMGNLTTPYPQVQKFYNHWLGFSTVKDFAWCDEYKVSRGPNRKLRRLMEEENKKIRSKARKEFNEAIRRLAAFVRKRDKRVLERQIEIQRLEKEKEEMRKARRKKEVEEKMIKARLYEEAEWTKIESEQDADDGSDFDESVGSYAWRQSHFKSNEAKKERQDEFYCIVCNKKFKSDEQWRNHERSKKHLEKVAILKESFEEEDEEFESISHTKMEDDNLRLEMKASVGRVSKGKESPTTSDSELLSANIRQKGKASSSIDNGAGDYQEERASAESNTGEGSALSTESESDDAGAEEGDGEDDEFDSLLSMVNSYASRQRQTVREDNEDTAEYSALGQDFAKEEGEHIEGEEEEMPAPRLEPVGQIQEATESSEDLENSLMNDETFVVEGDKDGELEKKIGGLLKKKKSKGRLRNEKQQAASLNRHSKVAEELMHEKQLGVIMQKFEGLDADEKESYSSMQGLKDETMMSGMDGICIKKTQKFENGHNRETLSKGKNANGYLPIDLEQPRRLARGKKSKGNAQSAILTCETCGEDFDSRNQLFKHLSATKHAALKGK